MNKLSSHHWVNMYLGILDGVFSLSEREQHDIIKEIKSLLDKLDVNNRKEPLELPAPVALELKAGFYTNLLKLTSNEKRAYRNTGEQNNFEVSVEAWRDPFINWLILAYPDLDSEDRILAAKSFEAVLINIGVPDRVPYYLPDDVIRAHLSGS